MSLVTNIVDLTTRVATEFKSIRILISGSGTGDTSALQTTSTNLVGAINEVLAAGASDAMRFKGVIDASSNPNYPAADRGDTYRISVAGRIGGASGTPVESGDILLCVADDTPAGTQAAVGASWTIIQSNIDGAVIGPASSVNNNFASFNGTSGKSIKDSGVSLSTSTSLGTSDSLIPSQNAVKVYADTKQPADATLAALAALTTSANQVPYSTGTDTFAMTALTEFGRSLLDDSNAAVARDTLSVYSQTDIGDPTTNFVTVFEAGLV